MVKYIFTALGRLKQKDCCEVEVSMSCMLRIYVKKIQKQKVSQVCLNTSVISAHGIQRLEDCSELEASLTLKRQELILITRLLFIKIDVI